MVVVDEGDRLAVERQEVQVERADVGRGGVRVAQELADRRVRQGDGPVPGRRAHLLLGQDEGEREVQLAGGPGHCRRHDIRSHSYLLQHRELQPEALHTVAHRRQLVLDSTIQIQ